MAIQYVVTAEELQSLLDQLQLEALRAANMGPTQRAPDFMKTQEALHNFVVDNCHRSFHMVATRWVQAMGYKGHRG